MYVVGLTGGIGSGKSTVAAGFAAHGVAIVDTDVIAHDLTAPGGAAMPALRQAFGDAVVAADGRLDRAAMRALVFADAGERQRLEAILHPAIRAESERRIAAAGAAPYVMLAVPLLVEAGVDYRARCDRILVVDCDEATQLARVVARSGLSEAEARAIIASQASRAARRAVADDILDNGGAPESLPAQIEWLHRRYLAAALSKVKANR